MSKPFLWPTHCHRKWPRKHIRIPHDQAVGRVCTLKWSSVRRVLWWGQTLVATLAHTLPFVFRDPINERTRPLPPHHSSSHQLSFIPSLNLLLYANSAHVVTPSFELISAWSCACATRSFWELSKWIWFLFLSAIKVAAVSPNCFSLTWPFGNSQPSSANSCCWG